MLHLLVHNVLHLQQASYFVRRCTLRGYHDVACVLTLPFELLLVLVFSPQLLYLLLDDHDNVPEKRDQIDDKVAVCDAHKCIADRETLLCIGYKLLDSAHEKIQCNHCDNFIHYFHSHFTC